MAGEGSRFLEAASAVGRKACPEAPKIDPADPPLTTSQPSGRRARLACTRPSSLKRPTALKSKAVLGRASHRNGTGSIHSWRQAQSSQIMRPVAPRYALRSSSERRTSIATCSRHIAPHCTVQYCTVLYCTVLNLTVLYCSVLYCTEHQRRNTGRAF